MKAHGLRGPFRISVPECGDDLPMMRAIIAAAIFRKGLALQFDPSVAASDHLQDIVNADEQLVTRGSKYPLVKLRVPMLELVVLVRVLCALMCFRD